MGLSRPRPWIKKTPGRMEKIGSDVTPRRDETCRESDTSPRAQKTFCLHQADTRKTICGALSSRGLTAKQPKRDFARSSPESYEMSEKRDSNGQWHRSTSGDHDSLPLRQSGQGTAIKDKLPRIITKKELRLIVPYSPQHILRLEKRGKFPNRVQLGARRVGWYLHEVHGWLQQRLRGATTVPFRKRV